MCYSAGDEDDGGDEDGGKVGGASHDALLAEVQRLEGELASIRTDLQEVMSCKGRCAQLDSLHTTVSDHCGIHKLQSESEDLEHRNRGVDFL